MSTEVTSAAKAGGRPKRREMSLIPNYVVLILLTIFALGPLVILFFNSLKVARGDRQQPAGIPAAFVWSNFTEGVGHRQLLHDHPK